jgi:site-specific DNA-methyltransferase (adenine-specific)
VSGQLSQQDYETVPVGRIQPHPDNARRGNLPLIRESIRTNGFVGACVVQRSTGNILVGNHRYLAAIEEGFAEIPVVWVDKSDGEARRLLLADNRTSDLAVYDDEALVELLIVHAADDGLVGTGWDDAELAALLAAIEPPRIVVDVDIPPLPVEAVTKVGDVILLGEHRLVCGDSFDPAVLDEAVAGLPVGCVLTDPPYGMNLDADYSKLPGGNAKSQMNQKPKKYRNVIGDDAPFDAAPIRERFSKTKEQFWFGADYYRRTLSGDDRDGSWLGWEKRTASDGEAKQDDVIGSGFETIWTATPHQRRILRHYWCGAFGTAEARERMHPTQKPVALLTDILERWAPPASIVADPFAGSGTCVLAAEQTGRICHAVELDPAYCDVIVARWEKLTGESAQRP